MARIPASCATRKRISELLSGECGKSELVKAAMQLIVEAALNAEVSEALRAVTTNAEQAPVIATATGRPGCSPRMKQPRFGKSTVRVDGLLSNGTDARPLSCSENTCELNSIRVDDLVSPLLLFVTRCPLPLAVTCPERTCL